jgi:hypothetical protein
MKTYVAVIGDAVGSRRLAGDSRRRRLQRDLKAAVTEVNRRWRSALAARFAVTLGDQFQGLLSGPASLWDIVHWLRAELHGSDWVIACGRGAIATPLAATAPEVDGPCFHLARGALEDAKRQRLLLAFAGFDPVVTAFAHYYSALYWSWTGRQRELACQLRVGIRAELPRKLRISRSAVSHVTSRIRWRLVEQADAEFRRRLAQS